jgi:hypothetical protein
MSRTLIVDPYVSNAVRLSRRSAPRPVGDITVAAIPARPAMSSRIAWNSAAARSETGASLMSANAAVGKVSACSLGEGDATLPVDGSTEAAASAPSEVGAHPASVTTRVKAATRA